MAVVKKKHPFSYTTNGLHGYSVDYGNGIRFRIVPRGVLIFHVGRHGCKERRLNDSLRFLLTRLNDIFYGVGRNVNIHCFRRLFKRIYKVYDL